MKEHDRELVIRNGQRTSIRDYVLLTTRHFFLYAATAATALVLAATFAFADVVDFLVVAAAIGLGVGVGAVSSAWFLIVRASWFEDQLQPFVLDQDPEPEPDPTPPTKDGYKVKIRTGRGEVAFGQPMPGAFAIWLRDVLDPDRKLQFSQKQARDRGWTEGEFNTMIGALLVIDWLKGRRNNAFSVNDQFRGEMNAWLREHWIASPSP